MNWKEQLGNIKQEGDRQDDRVDPREAKKKSRIMYNRRRLDKDIRALLNQNIIKYADIERVHRKHGIHVS